MTKPIIWDVDTQKDFIDENGKLSVPGAVDIKQNINTVLSLAQKYGVDIYGSVDAHPEDDDEFNMYPAHCVVDTEGQKKIPESVISHKDNIYYVPNNGQGVDMTVFQGAQQVYFEKQCVNIWDKTKGQPDNIQTLLRMTDVTDVIVIGVATDICVIEAVKGFVERDYNVFVVDEAVKGLSVESEMDAREKMGDLGVKFITLKELDLQLENY